MNTRTFGLQDRVIGEIDRIIKNLTLSPRASRGVPQTAPGETLPETERAESVRLMRVNHAGEVAAQALYQGQALTARNPTVKSAMHEAAAEEIDHLAWCEQRLKELKGRPHALLAQQFRSDKIDETFPPTRSLHDQQSSAPIRDMLNGVLLPVMESRNWIFRANP